MASYAIHVKASTYQLVVNGYTLEADGVRLKSGDVKCSLAAYQGTTVVWRDTVSLGTANGRAKVVQGLAARGVTVDDAALLALEEAIRNVLKATPHSNGKVIAFPTAAPAPTPTAKSLDQVHAIFREWLEMPDTGALDVALAAVAANHQSGDPIWLLIIDAPGGGKTEIINAISGLSDVHSLATLTEASLLSGTSEQEKATNATGGILRSVGDFGVLALKDFGSILSMQQDARSVILAALREIYDGRWERAVGTDGGQMLEWHGKLGLVGGGTPAIDRHHSVLATLGERFVFYRPTTNDDDRQARADKALSDLFAESTMRAKLREAVAALFAGLDLTTKPAPLTDPERQYLIKLASLTVLCRSAVDRDPRNNREIVDVPEPEYPTRLVKVLAQLWYGLRLIGVEYERAWELVRHVALSSMPKGRRITLEYLAAQSSPQLTSDIGTALSMETDTVRFPLEELMCHRIAKRIKGNKHNEYSWELTELGRGFWQTVSAPPSSHGTGEGGIESKGESSSHGTWDGGRTSNTEGGEGERDHERESPLYQLPCELLAVGDWVLPLSAAGQLLTADPSPVFSLDADFALLLDTGADPDDSGKGGGWFWWQRDQCELVLSVADTAWPDGESAETMLPPRPPGPCRICGNTETRYDTVAKEWVCTVCQPS